MKPILTTGNIRADCPDCGVPSSFEFRMPAGSDFGVVVSPQPHVFNDLQFSAVQYRLYRCAACHRPGIAKLHLINEFTNPDTQLEYFWPSATPRASLPSTVPAGVVKEFREAEMCMSVQAWRGAAALLRSTLEKTLIANGYQERDLYKKIEAAGDDGVITSARRQRAQDLVRTLGNDVLHEDWREVTQIEAESAYHYVGRIIEDLYDDRSTVEAVLTAKSRQFVPAAQPDSSGK